MNAKLKTRRSSARKRILLVDDHPIMREGVAQWIQQTSDLMVCGQVESASQALMVVAKVKPDLVLTDISLGSRNGLDLIKDLVVLLPGLPVLVYSMHDESLYAARALAAGARGYVMKHEGGGRLLSAIRDALLGHITLSPEMATRLLEEFTGHRPRAARTTLSCLSDREIEILQLLGEVKSNREIGVLLHLSPKTVESHRMNLMHKLNLSNSSELLRFALQFATQDASGPLNG